ncbi:DedA family protein [Microcella sp.]|uniref:DedA family protein n=1 Tax=Microcella sp. TaxID=1913979 RepID=UPI00391A678B
MSIDQWAISVMETLGVVGAALLVAIESLFPPIPSELILPLAGFTASRGSFDLVSVIVATTIGSVVGALLLYGLGRWIGAERLARIADRIPLMSGTDVEKAMAWFHRFGPIAVLLGRFVPIVRSLISIPAGVDRMRLWLFLLLTTIGSGIWNTLFVVLGFVLGENWVVVEDIASRYSRAVLVIAIVVVVALIAWRIVLVVRRRRAERDSASTDSATPEA